MAEAIIKGILESKISFAPEIRISGIPVSDIDEKRLKGLKQNILVLDKKHLVNTYTDNKQVAKLSEIVLLAVKPQNMGKVVDEIEIDEGKLVISIAAGITINFLEKAFPNIAIIRAMPNNPASIGAGITAIAKGKKVKQEQFKQAWKIFGSVGEVVEVEEDLMDAVTGLSGSGPAFVYSVIEALAKAGKKLGIEQKTAQKLAVETVLGAARTMKETGKSPKELREMVASPGGTTIEGLKVLEKKKFAEALVEAVIAAAKKSEELSR